MSGWLEKASGSISGMLKPKVPPQQQLREWQRKLRQEIRNVDRQIRDIQREEAGVKRTIRETAKRGDLQSCRHLAKELVRSRKVVSRMHEQKAQMNSIAMHLGENVAMARAVGHLEKSTEVMKMVNSLMKAPEVAATMQEMSMEMQKAGLMEEMVNEGLDDALDTDGIEEETEEEVDRVLSEIATETTTAMPSAVRRRQQQPQDAVEADAEEVQPVAAEDVEGDPELEALRARLNNART